jgi:peptidoglycan/LPS O-acetylase OafA/YrhL
MTRFSTERSATYIPGLDGIRAIAFLLVYGSHVGLEYLIPGGLGVTIFFFLSGYLITTLLRVEMKQSGKISISQFYLRRTLRIFPPMYVTLVVWMSLASLGVLVGSPHWQPIVLASVYLANYVGALTSHRLEGGLVVLWSLSVEEHFYLLFPWLLVLFLRSRRSFRAVAPALAGLCTVALAWRLILVLHFHSIPATTYNHTDTRFDSILFGCLLAVSLNPLLDAIPARIRRHSASLAVVGLVVLLGCLIFRGPVFRETFRYSIQGLALAPIFLFVLDSPGTWPVRFLEHPLLRFAGRRSYAMYLIHLCILDAVHAKLGVNLFWTGLISAPLVVGYSYAMWQLVEIPIGRFKKSRFRARESREPRWSSPDLAEQPIKQR